VSNVEPSMPKPLVWPNYGPVSVGPYPLRHISRIGPSRHQERERLYVIWNAVRITALASLMGCSNLSTTTYVKAELPLSLIEPCPDLPDIPDRSERSVARWIVDTVTLYYECSASKRRLVEAVK
jgi:hypothetical protein